jgi:hypothetical protein
MPRQEGAHVKRPKGAAKQQAQSMKAVDRKRITRHKQQKTLSAKTTRPI